MFATLFDKFTSSSYYERTFILNTEILIKYLIVLIVIIKMRNIVIIKMRNASINGKFKRVTKLSTQLHNYKHYKIGQKAQGQQALWDNAAFLIAIERTSLQRTSDFMHAEVTIYEPETGMQQSPYTSLYTCTHISGIFRIELSYTSVPTPRSCPTTI